jgi:dTDP-4-dehydrorhamnose 3,5-epimerase
VHAEPWDKLVSVATGRAFGAWVDLREGPGFGAVFHLELDPSVAVFVPRGVGNSYQTLEDATAYSYLINAHWRPGRAYDACDLGDPALAIPWPIPLAEADLSDKDRSNPALTDVSPVPARRHLVLGGGGQLAIALAEAFPSARVVTIDELDLTDAAALDAWPWHQHDVVLNAAAYTAVDAAETPGGRRDAWAINAVATGRLAHAAREHGLTLVHYSTDYVFDGSIAEHDEDEPLSPLGVYGQSKAAGELASVASPRHYLLRTSWMVGAGPNFVRTMLRLAGEGARPSVVSDQVGRLTFADELARATRHLVDTGAAYGTYHVTNGGPPMSWADVAKEVFRLAGRDPDDVEPVTTEDYGRGKQLAPRPLNGTLSLAKLRGTGFDPEDALTALARYASSAALP